MQRKTARVKSKHQQVISLGASSTFTFTNHQQVVLHKFLHNCFVVKKSVNLFNSKTFSLLVKINSCTKNIPWMAWSTANCKYGSREGFFLGFFHSFEVPNWLYRNWFAFQEEVVHKIVCHFKCKKWTTHKSEFISWRAADTNVRVCLISIALRPRIWWNESYMHLPEHVIYNFILTFLSFDLSLRILEFRGNTNL